MGSVALTTVLDDAAQADGGKDPGLPTWLNGKLLVFVIATHFKFLKINHKVQTMKMNTPIPKTIISLLI